MSITIRNRDLPRILGNLAKLTHRTKNKKPGDNAGLPKKEEKMNMPLAQVA